MHRLLTVFLFLILLSGIGCETEKNPVADVYRGFPISGDQLGYLTIENSPYLVIDTLRVPVGQTWTIQAGVEIRFDLITDNGLERALPLEVYGTIIAEGDTNAPIVFTSGLLNPTRGDWDGIWLFNNGADSRFEYCKFNFGAKYGRKFHYKPSGTGQLDSSLFDYGSLTLVESSPSVKHCWFVAGGFHGLHCDSLSEPIVENCVFYDNAGHGVFVHADANPTINYSIITENDDYGVYCREFGVAASRRSDLNLNYSIIWSNFSGEFNALAPQNLGRPTLLNENLDVCDYRHNLRLDPSYMDAENWNFRLTSLSAAIDAGPDSLANPDIGDPTRIELGIWPYKFIPNEIRRLFTVDTLFRSLSPYIITSDVQLPRGKKLMIEAGVEVDVMGRYQITVGGQIQALGTENNRVTFKSGIPNAGSGSWIGIIFYSNSAAGTEFNHTDIMHGRYGLYLNQSDVKLDNCVISNCDLFGIVCENFSNPIIENTTFIDNALASVICAYNSSPKIYNSVFVRGAGYAIDAIESSRPEIKNCVIIQPGVAGIRLENLSDAKIVNNTFFNCKYFAINSVGNSSPDVRNNIFYSNGDELRGGIGITATRSSDPTIEWNFFYDHVKSAVSISSDTTAIDTVMNFWGDPVFERLEWDAEHKYLIAWDLSLKPSSPCIGQGDPNILNNDLISRSDIGAYGGPEGR